MYLKQDLLFGLRGLSRDRGFGLTAILVLGLGIGVNNMLFTLIYGHTSVALLLIVITIAACAIPMRRVSRLNPVAVLSED